MSCNRTFLFGNYRTLSFGDHCRRSGQDPRTEQPIPHGGNGCEAWWSDSSRVSCCAQTHERPQKNIEGGLGQGNSLRPLSARSRKDRSKALPKRGATRAKGTLPPTRFGLVCLGSGNSTKEKSRNNPVKKQAAAMMTIGGAARRILHELKEKDHNQPQSPKESRSAEPFPQGLSQAGVPE